MFADRAAHEEAAGTPAFEPALALDAHGELPMKVLAQIGHGVGDKLANGLQEGLVDGGIFSPKDLRRDTLRTKISEVRQAFPGSDVLVDPQFYVSLFADAPNVNPGHLPQWDYFRAYRKGDLESSRTIRGVLKACLCEVADLEVTALVAPNIFISQSLDSREAVVAKNFIREAAEVHAELGDSRPLYASLVVCREALQDRREFDEFINDITLLDAPPKGIYLVVAGHSSEARQDLFHTDVLANWMLLNLSFSTNGLEVINGYSDVLTPFLGVAGGTAGATGWYSNLRAFSMGRFFPVGGGRQPIVRYLSKLLLNRVRFDEKDATSMFVPEIINGLSHDADYSPDADRNAEALQSWEAIRSLTDEMVEEIFAPGSATARPRLSGRSRRMRKSEWLELLLSEAL